MPSIRGNERQAKAMAERELADFVYPPSEFVAPKVYNDDRRYAVLVVDMVEDFITGKLATKRMVHNIPNVANLLDAARANDVPVVYTNDSHTPADFELNRWKPHAMRGTKGAKVIKELTPKKSDYVIPKSSYSGFQGTHLETMLKGLYGGKGANTLAIAGVTTDCCVKHTTADAFFRGFEVEVVGDGVEAFTEAQHRLGLAYIRYWYLSDVTSSRQLIKKLGA